MRSRRLPLVATAIFITANGAQSLRSIYLRAILCSLFPAAKTEVHSLITEAEFVLSTDAGFELFDDQAAMFDQRAGMPVEYCQAIANAVVEIGQLAPDDLILEVGPGTGLISLWFSAPIRYIRID